MSRTTSHIVHPDKSVSLSEIVEYLRDWRSHVGEERATADNSALELLKGNPVNAIGIITQRMKVMEAWVEAGLKDDDQDYEFAIGLSCDMTHLRDLKNWLVFLTEIEAKKS